ncbi:MAG TPA: sigma factor-like helix-turn-helix DNA-binding protein, partial [Polyangiaceae bacterium]
AVRDFRSERASPPVYATFLQAWQAQLGALESIPRMVVTRRAGMHGAQETLEELGGMLGLTRERVRQIEVRVVERLAERSRWRRSVEANLATAFGSARALPLDLLAQDPWWAGIDQQEHLLDYVVRRIFEDQLFVLEAPSGRRYLTKFGPSDFVARLESAKTRVAKLEYPVEISVIDAILHNEADPLDPVLFAELQRAVDELLHRDAANPNLALGYGRYRYDEVLAFLNGQPEPVRVEVIEEKFGRGGLPEEILYFKRGLVGLKRHFPDFDDWSQRLVPAALEVMQERPAGRQWLVPEIHDALRERGLVPEWLGHWHLASVLRLSDQVDYLGRLRVALKDGGQELRLQYLELLQGILEAAGAPLTFDELLVRARVQTDIPEATATLRVAAPPFVRLDDSHIGLVERDIPGGPLAVAAAIEAVIRVLNDTQLGLTPHQATRIVNALSPVHASWTRQLVTSVLRNESSLRIDRTKNIGLDEWDDARCPTRPEFMRREVQQAGGRLALSELYARMDNFYGRAPDRGSLGVMAQQVGLTIVGEFVLRAPSVAPESAVERVAINLTGVPAELREMFQDLVHEPLSDIATLRTQVNQHVDAMAEAYQVNEFVDLPGAHILARQCHFLLDRWGSLPLSDRHLVHAAVRYFISWDDVENDLDIGGLDDDKQIMNAVLSYLGIDESSDGALAS